MADTSMTRRTFVGAGALLGAGLLTACGSQTQDAPAEEQAVEEEPRQEAEPESKAPADETGTESAGDESKILVVYYSRADENYPNEWLEVGHTKVMAGYIAEALGADQYEIVPVEAYPEGYDECCDVAMQEQRDDARPAIANALPDVSGYGTVFVGCPIWWGDEPRIVRTFVEGVDLSGKTIVPFTTHGGSGLGGVPANLQEMIPDARFLEGHAVAGTAVDSSRDEIVTWAMGLDLA